MFAFDKYPDSYNDTLLLIPQISIICVIIFFHIKYFVYLLFSQFILIILKNWFYNTW